MDLRPGPTDEDVALGHALADLAGQVALDYFSKGVAARAKADGTPVTEADLSVERQLVAMLSDRRPGDGILAEEGSTRPGSKRRWILDPIDGTVNFAAGDPNWGTHVALEVSGEVVLGIVTRPVAGLRWWAVRGAGAFRGVSSDPGEAVPLRVSTVGSLDQARVTLWPPDPSLAVDALKAAGVWVDPDWSVLANLLDGDLDAVIARTGGVWDHAPAVVLTEAAGGRFRDPRGGRRLDLRGGVFTNGLLDDALDRLLGH